MSQNIACLKKKVRPINWDSITVFQVKIVIWGVYRSTLFLVKPRSIPWLIKNSPTLFMPVRWGVHVPFSNKPLMLKEVESEQRDIKIFRELMAIWAATMKGLWRQHIQNIFVNCDSPPILGGTSKYLQPPTRKLLESYPQPASSCNAHCWKNTHFWWKTMGANFCYASKPCDQFMLHFIASGVMDVYSPSHMCHRQNMVYGLWSSILYWESLQWVY